MLKLFIDILTLIGALGVALGVFVWVSQTPEDVEIVQPIEYREESRATDRPSVSEHEYDQEQTPPQTITQEREVFLGAPEIEEAEEAEEEIVAETPKKPLVTATEKKVVITETHEDSSYDFPPYDVATLNNHVRAALVNILCESSSSDFKSISGSGIIIDPRGVILTNAHIAQHVLLSQHSQVPVSCKIRTGSPAQPAWYAQVLFIPPAWIEKHASDIQKLSASGTGEDDYALLLIDSSTTGSPLPASFPSISSETREKAALTGDSVLVAGYPAEFGGSSAARNSLYASTATSEIQEVLTFESGTVDILSLGSTPLAQSGSSGGAVVNMWGQLVGIVVTTSDGATTGTRDLRAATLSHVNRSVSASTGTGLHTFLEGDLKTLLSKLSSQNNNLIQLLLAHTALGN